jgi:hypothetical protein
MSKALRVGLISLHVSAEPKGGARNFSDGLLRGGRASIMNQREARPFHVSPFHRFARHLLFASGVRAGQFC